MRKIRQRCDGAKGQAKISRNISTSPFSPLVTTRNNCCDDQSTHNQHVLPNVGVDARQSNHFSLLLTPSLQPQLLVSVWDRETSLDVLGHWLSMMHVHDSAAEGAAGTGCSGGWLPREQILGEEARRRVPAAFMAQVSLEAQTGAQERHCWPWTVLLCFGPDTAGHPSLCLVFVVSSPTG